MLGLKVARAAAVAGAFVAAGCSLPEGDYFGEVAENPDPTHLRWCNSGEPEYIDPALVTSTAGTKLVNAMFDGLSQFGLDGMPRESLATSWDITHNLRKFTFHLTDRARWSNGRPLTAHDFRYHLMRILHPDTASRNAETLWRLKNGRLYNVGRVKKVLRDSPPFEAGDIVEIVGLDGKVADNISKTEIPDSNVRTSTQPLRLRDVGAEPGEAYATVPPGEEVDILELGGDGDAWAYVFWPGGGEGSGVYGWVEKQRLDGSPHADVAYTVREVPPEHVPGVMLEPGPDAERRQGTVAGEDLLMLPEVLGVRVPDDHTLVLETWGPAPYMISLTPDRTLRPSPREAVSRWPKNWTEPDKIVTSGPFHLTGWFERDRMEFERSDTYWKKDEVKIERFTAFNMDDQAASANYYRTGGCDAITSNNVPSSYLPVLNGEKRGGEPYEDYTSAPYYGIYYYMINVDKLDNVHFRRALNLATDRRPIPELIHGGQNPTAQFNPGTEISELSPEERALCGVEKDDPGVAIIVKPGELCYAPPPGLDYDLEEAKKELAIAREQMGDDFPQSFTIKFNKGTEGHKLVAEYLQFEWSTKLGLDVGLESQEWKTYLKATTNGEYDVARMGWIGSFPSPSEMLKIFKCDAPNNRTGWCSDEFDDLFKKAERARSHQERLEYMRAAERVVLEEAPSIPLYVYTQHHLQKPYVKDLGINFVDKPPLHRAWIDPDWQAEEAD